MMVRGLDNGSLKIETGHGYNKNNILIPREAHLEGRSAEDNYNKVRIVPELNAAISTFEVSGHKWMKITELLDRRSKNEYDFPVVEPKSRYARPPWDEWWYSGFFSTDLSIFTFDKVWLK